VAVKTNERPGTRAVLRYCRMSSYKVREVLDLVRGMELSRALEILDHTDRAAAPVVAKLVRSAAANALHNEGLDPEEMYLASAFADEGTTLKRWRPRARGRATRIRKRTCHITVVLARMPEEKLARRRARVAAEATDRRARRVAGTRRASGSAAGRAQADAVAETAVDPALDQPGLDEPVSWVPEDAEATAAHAEARDDEAVDAVEVDTTETPASEDAATDATASGEDAD
jgi:large subunit ribosomal protein L22